MATRQQIEQNKKKQAFLNANGVKVKIDGSWGPWQQGWYNKIKAKQTEPKQNWFTRSTIGAAMAENPAIMAASGWQQDKQGDYVQKRNKGSNELAEDLAVISWMAPSHPGNVIIDQALKRVVFPAATFLGRGALAEAKQYLPTVYSFGKKAVKGVNNALGNVFSKGEQLAAKAVNKGSQDINLKQISEEKEQFVQNMDDQEIEFKAVRKHPELTSYINKAFLKPEQAADILPKEGSNLSNYLNWMDKTFSIHTPKVAKAYPSTEFPKFVAGYYEPATDIAKINTAYPKYARSTFIHELGSHGTDMQVIDRVVDNYPFKLRYQSIGDFLKADIGKFRPDRTVENIYTNIAGIKPGLGSTIKNRWTHRNFKLTHGINHQYNSNDWREARATLNEIRAKLFKQADVPYSQQYLERAIDQVSDEEILNLIRDTNAYGADYYRAYNLLSPKQQKEWMGRVRHALKYLPSTAPIGFGVASYSNNE